MRKSIIKRKTKETNVKVIFNLDGQGKYRINTTIPFMDHMLGLFAFHGNFDLIINAKGDRDIDDHHLVEDIGIALGEAFSKSLGNNKNIERFGQFLIPMDETLSYVAIDISGRFFLKYDVKFNRSYKWLKSEFNYNLIEDFFLAFVSTAKITMHIVNKYGRSNHHIAESIFKGFGKALSQAAAINPKRKTVSSTKGRL
jgi:imidazoleglycerol-phosphate dehydratase